MNEAITNLEKLKESNSFLDMRDRGEVLIDYLQFLTRALARYIDEKEPLPLVVTYPRGLKRRDQVLRRQREEDLKAWTRDYARKKPEAWTLNGWRLNLTIKEPLDSIEILFADEPRTFGLRNVGSYLDERRHKRKGSKKLYPIKGSSIWSWVLGKIRLADQRKQSVFSADDLLTSSGGQEVPCVTLRLEGRRVS